jgi:hypothetical protein
MIVWIAIIFGKFSPDLGRTKQLFDFFYNYTVCPEEEGK